MYQRERLQLYLVKFKSSYNLVARTRTWHHSHIKFESRLILLSGSWHLHNWGESFRVSFIILGFCGRGQPRLLFTLSSGESSYFDDQGEMRRSDWLGNS